MNEPGTYYEVLMAAYFSGEATPDEVMRLSAWLTGDPANIDVFEAYRQVWLLTAKDAIDEVIDVEAEWENLSARMEPESLKTFGKTKKANKGKLLQFTWSWKAAAIAIVLVVAASLLFYLNSDPALVRVAALDNNLEQVLPDGSVITLNRGSEISYPEKFGDDTREVKLKGEAYFNVTKNTKRPFIVSGGDARIKVMGTSFNVNTGSDGRNISVVLTTGKVALYYKGSESEEHLLNPGEKAEMNSEKKSIITVSNPDPNYMAWKTGIIVFENAGLKEIVATLSKVYNTEIRLPDKQPVDCSLTATFEKQPLSRVLNVIGETLGLSIRQQNGVVIFEGSGCN